jgi:hypothetical protein
VNCIIILSCHPKREVGKTNKMNKITDVTKARTNAPPHHQEKKETAEIRAKLYPPQNSVPGAAPDSDDEVST